MASGAGPSVALTGTANAHTGGVSSTTIQLPASTDLSGVATDGSHVIKLFTGSGRRFSKITAKDDGADTVTVEDAFNIAAPGVNWAIGDKLATLDDADNRTLFVFSTGAKPGWILEIEDDQSLTSTITIAAAGSSAAGFIRLRGAPAAGEVVVITQTINGEVFDGNFNSWHFERLHFKNSNGTKTSAHGVRVTAASERHSFKHCIFGDATNSLNAGYSASVNSALPVFVDCEFKECSGTNAVGLAAGGGHLFGCSVHDNDQGGIAFGIATTGDISVVNCLVYANGGDGISWAAECSPLLIGNTIHGNGGNGIDVSASSVFGHCVIANNQITGNTLLGINVSSGSAEITDANKAFVDFNNFWDNDGGDRQNISAGPNDTAVDPAYVNAAAGNFEVGQSVRAQGFPDSARTIGANQSQTNSFVDIGAAQRDENLGGVILGARRRVR